MGTMGISLEKLKYHANVGTGHESLYRKKINNEIPFFPICIIFYKNPYVLNIMGIYSLSKIDEILYA